VKKVLKVLFIICLTFSFWLVLSKKAQAKENQEFQNITFEATPKLFNSNKITCIITWKSSERIFYIKVNALLQNNGGQVFELMVDQVKKDGNQSFVSDYIEEDGIYYNVLKFDLYYFQAGNMQITFNYAHSVITPGEETLSKTFVFVNNDWKTKQTTKNAIICGVVITICIAITTYISIENSERHIVFGHNQDEDEENES